ncbi:serpin family protein [Microlunatus antarcticus]|uniref:Serpin B n=1 Tax=Microlunatus antarcticus TaxID=53388 RepID=A0A7W5JW60_9ACTN|nr:serpin B [Microlunatus antarcticus]
MQRRQLLVSAAALVGGAALLGGVTGCGSSGDLVRAEVTRAAPEPERAAGTVDAVGRFSLDLLAHLDTNANVVCSPLSVLVALAMVRNGAAGATAAELDRALRFPALDDLNAGMNLIDQTLAKRSGKRGAGDRKGKVELDLANAVWGQQGYTWQERFLQTLAADYGTGVHPTDFSGDAAGARKAVNAWVADRTHGKITDIATPDVIDADTVLALANAFHARAPWTEPFVVAGDRPFLVGGDQVPVPMIRSGASPYYVSGPGWEGARIPLLGEELALTVVLPDGDVGALVTGLRASGLSGLLDTESDDLVDLTLPTFTVRSTIDLKPPLTDLGLETAFTDAAEFPGLTTSDQLKLQAAKHMGYLALDENGIEAAAATVVTVEGVSGSAGPGHELVVDRPFFFVLHDVALALPLLGGVVVDPR